MTLIGNAVYLSMDIPDAFLGVRMQASLLLNHIDSLAVVEALELPPVGEGQNRCLHGVHRDLEASMAYV